MNDDMEARLRRTYRAVAERTVDVKNASSGSLQPVEPAPTSPRRWLGPALVAAAVLVLVGGLAAIDRGGPEMVADSMGTRVLPTVLPTPFAPPTDLAGGRPPLVAIASAADTDVLEYASDVLTVAIRMDRTRLDELDGPTVEVRGGLVATTEGDDDSGRLRWNPSSMSTVTIEWTGPVFEGLDSIVEVAHGMLFVDDEAWEKATEFGGFTRDRELLRREIGTMEVSVRGDLQSGLVFGVDSASSFPASETSCSVFEGLDGTTWLAVGGASSNSATMTWPDGFVATTELSPFFPGSAIGAGVVERPDSDLEEQPNVVCEQAS